MNKWCAECERTHGVLECEAYCAVCGHAIGLHKPICLWKHTSKGSKDIITVHACSCTIFIVWKDTNVPSSN
jgi:hypothetical protein